MTALIVLLGGGIGALLRYYTERWSVHRFGERIPYGTAMVNLAGAALIGGIAGGWHRGLFASFEWEQYRAAYLLVGTGFCGGLTTFSGFMGQVESRWRHRATRHLAIGYVVSVTGVGVVLVLVTQALVRAG